MNEPYSAAKLIEELENNLSTVDLARYFDSGANGLGVTVRTDINFNDDRSEVDRGPLGAALLRALNRAITRHRHQRYNRLTVEKPELPRVVAEGDSWFLHPLIDDVIDQLSGGQQPRMAIKSFAGAGEMLSTMWRVNKLLDAAEMEGARIMLLSGGGNDVLGDQFPAFLNSWTADNGRGVGRLLNENFETKLRHLRSIYEQVASEARRKVPRAVLVTHCYDYVRPGVEKPDAAKFEAKGKWLGKHLDAAGITNSEERNDLLRHVIDRFYDDVLGTISNERNVLRVDTRGSVGNHEWYDEIHPDGSGFSAVALRILRALDG